MEETSEPWDELRSARRALALLILAIAGMWQAGATVLRGLDPQVALSRACAASDGEALDPWGEPLVWREASSRRGQPIARHYSKGPDRRDDQGLGDDLEVLSSKHPRVGLVRSIETFVPVWAILVLVLGAALAAVEQPPLRWLLTACSSFIVGCCCVALLGGRKLPGDPHLLRAAVGDGVVVLCTMTFATGLWALVASFVLYPPQTPDDRPLRRVQ